MNGRELDLFWILVTVWEEVNGDLVWKCQKLSLKVAKLQLCLVPPAPQMRHSEDKPRLVVFSDGSSVAYAAAVYVIY